MSCNTPYQVLSTNFQHHAPVPAESYPQALAVAKERGFEASIYARAMRRDGKMGDVLVATWSPLYGVKVYNRDLAAAS